MEGVRQEREVMLSGGEQLVALHSERGHNPQVGIAAWLCETIAAVDSFDP